MAAEGRKLTLKSSDGEVFEVEELVAMESQTIKHAIEDVCAESGIPLPNVTSKILLKVIEYCKKHVESAPKSASDDTRDKAVDEELEAWDADFVNVDQATLFDLIEAANYLNIKSLLHLTCQTSADMIKGKTTEEIRKTLNIENDFTPEEEAAWRENPMSWRSYLYEMCQTVDDMIKWRVMGDILSEEEVWRLQLRARRRRIVFKWCAAYLSDVTWHQWPRDITSQR